MQLLPLSIRIPLGLTIAVVILGIVIFLRERSLGVSFPPAYVIAWLVLIVVLVGITIVQWRRKKD